MANSPTSLSIPSVHAASLHAIAAAAGVIEPSVLAPIAAFPSAPAIAISAKPHGLVVGPAEAAVSYGAALKAISAEVPRVRSELDLNYAHLRDQGRGWYRLSMASAAVGFSVITLAVIFLILGNLTIGLVTTASSIVPNAVSSLFFVQSRRAARRLDLVTQELAKSREVNGLIEMASVASQGIDDPRLRDEVKAEIVRKILAIGSASR